MKRVLLALLCALPLTGCFSTVGTGYRGVVLNWSKPSGEIKSEGIFFYAPFTGYGIVDMNVQTQALHVKSTASTKDIQPVNTETTVNFHLDPSKVVTIYDNLRDDYEQRVLSPTIQEAVKAATARHNAPDLLANRAIVRDQIETALQAKMRPYGIFVDQVLLTDMRFSDQYQQAVEQKVAAQQQAQTAVIQAQQKKDVAKLEADAAVYKANGESKAQALQRTTISPALIQMEMVKRWNGQFPQVMGNSNPFVMLGKPPTND